MPSNLLLRMEQISKAFPGVQALQSVDFDLCEGEVHALVGENGAGKSTLIKVLAGVYRPDAGTVWLAGRQLHARSPRDMMNVGLRVIYQELNLVPGLSVAENLFLGREPIRGGTRGVIDWPEMYRQSADILERFGLRIDPRAKTSQLGVAYQQIVEIAKAVSCDVKVVVMDEPTAALTERETEQLFGIIRDLKQQRVSVIYISHRLEEIRRIADRVTVLRDGRRIITAPQQELPSEQIIRHMVGRSVGEYYPKEDSATWQDLAGSGGTNAARRLSRRVLSAAQRGNPGPRRTGGFRQDGDRGTVLRAVQKPDGGVIRIGGAARLRAITAACHGTRDGFHSRGPQTRGARAGDVRVRQRHTRHLETPSVCSGIVRRKRLAEMVQHAAKEIRLKAASPAHLVKYLSGGNQQKVVLAKWLLHDCQIYIFDEPTRGVDVGAKSEIYRLMEDLARRGAGIIMISSDLPEVLEYERPHPGGA